MLRIKLSIEFLVLYKNGGYTGIVIYCFFCFVFPKNLYFYFSISVFKVNFEYIPLQTQKKKLPELKGIVAKYDL